MNHFSRGGGSMKRNLCMWACLLAALITPITLLAEDKLTQVHQDLSQDPGWDWANNRIRASDPPIVKQDFGWSESNHAGGGTGEIGGKMWQSRTPAWYAMPLNHPLSFKEPFSFSCRIAFTPSGGN